MNKDDKITIRMSERSPIRISKSEWPTIACGEWFSGQYPFQSYDGAQILVRRHADGRLIVYGYAGDWDGGGRPTREDRTAGFFLNAGDDVVRAIRRVGGILADTEYVGNGAHTAERDCIADLPAQDVDAPTEAGQRTVATTERAP